MHVYDVPAFDFTSSMVTPLVLLTVLSVTVFAGNPIGISLIFVERILFSNITGSINPLSINCPLSGFIITISGAVI